MSKLFLKLSVRWNKLFAADIGEWLYYDHQLCDPPEKCKHWQHNQKFRKLVMYELPWAQGETISLTRGDGDDFAVFVPPSDWPDAENTVFFVARDKRGYERLAAKLQHIVTIIQKHNESCDCP